MHSTLDIMRRSLSEKTEWAVKKMYIKAIMLAAV